MSDDEPAGIPGVQWSDDAWEEWFRLADRAPAQALAVYRGIAWLAARPEFPFLGHPDPDGRDRRGWPVPPHTIFYRWEKGELIVLEIADKRRGG